MEFGPQFRQGGIGVFVQKRLQAGPPGLGQQGLATAKMSLGFQRAALLEVLAHAAHGGHAIAQTDGNLPGAFAQIIQVENALTHRDRNRFHGP